MIVKVQLSLASSEEKQQILLYNETRAISYEGPAPESVIAKMAGRSKAFFHATTYWTEVVLGDEAPYQPW